MHKVDAYTHNTQLCMHMRVTHLPRKQHGCNRYPAHPELLLVSDLHVCWKRRWVDQSQGRTSSQILLFAR